MSNPVLNIVAKSGIMAELMQAWRDQYQTCLVELCRWAESHGGKLYQSTGLDKPQFVGFPYDRAPEGWVHKGRSHFAPARANKAVCDEFSALAWPENFQSYAARNWGLPNRFFIGDEAHYIHLKGMPGMADMFWSRAADGQLGHNILAIPDYEAILKAARRANPAVEVRLDHHAGLPPVLLRSALEKKEDLVVLDQYELAVWEAQLLLDTARYNTMNIDLAEIWADSAGEPITARFNSLREAVPDNEVFELKLERLGETLKISNMVSMTTSLKAWPAFMAATNEYLPVAAALITGQVLYLSNEGFSESRPVTRVEHDHHCYETSLR